MQLPDRAERITFDYPTDKLCRSQQVNLNQLNLMGEHILIVGGSLTSGHLAKVSWRMAKLLGQFIFATVIVSLLGFGFWILYEPWFKLSKAFGSTLTPPEIFFEQQSCILGQTRIQGYVNIGITEDKLYLSHTSPLSYFIHPLLINLDAITKIER